MNRQDKEDNIFYHIDTFIHGAIIGIIIIIIIAILGQLITPFGQWLHNVLHLG